MIVTFSSPGTSGVLTDAALRTARTISDWGYRTLYIDWRTTPGRTAPGLVNLFDDRLMGHDSTAEKYAEFSELAGGGELLLLPFGHGALAEDGRDEWVRRYREHDLGGIVQDCAEQWRGGFDLVVIDGRPAAPGRGTYLAQLPDAVIMTCAAADAASAVELVARADEARDRLPYDLGRILAVPVLAGDEAAARQAADGFAPWLDAWVGTRSATEDVLAALTPKQGSDEPWNLLAALIALDFADTSVLTSDPLFYLDAARHLAGGRSRAIDELIELLGRELESGQWSDIGHVVTNLPTDVATLDLATVDRITSRLVTVRNAGSDEPRIPVPDEVRALVQSLITRLRGTRGPR